MQKYMKKPLIAEAVQLSMENLQECMDQMTADGYQVTTYSKPPMRAVSGLAMKTENGIINVNFGEYLMKGIQGEYYPCPADVFEKSYDLVIEDKPDGE